MTTIEALNELNPSKAADFFERTCGASKWIEQMVGYRPFDSVDELLNLAEAVWWSLDEEAWLEAFRHHPKIGDVSELRKRFAKTGGLSESEQSGVNEANEVVLERLATGNRLYEEKFGYIFIVFATGKSALEMADLLDARLPHRPDAEIKVAAGEQLKITLLRLNNKLEEA
ncbi:MAG: 2-oxo-4-hydroxy-4-carboxy-5-ureidoimidazoline decarboxylase [Chloroflexota bacterium]